MGKNLADMYAVLIEIMLYLFLVVAVKVSARIVLSVKTRLEINMKTIVNLICGFGGGALLLGRVRDIIVSILQEIRVNQLSDCP